MISDQVIQAYPLCGMVTRASVLTFVTEQDGARYFMSLNTPEGTVRILEFDTLQAATDATAKFLGANTGLIQEVITDFEIKIGKILV